MNTQLIRAKVMCYNRWFRELNLLKDFPKCKGYGIGETLETIWEKLPQPSKEYWLLRAI